MCGDPDPRGSQGKIEQQACDAALAEDVGAAFYRNILREYERVNQPKLIL